MTRQRESATVAGRLRTGNRGAVNMEYLFGGALAVVIIGAVALTIYFGWMHTAKGKDTNAHFTCYKCGKEFLVDLFKEQPGEILDCRVCDGKQTAVRMVVCPKCNNWTPLYDKNYKQTLVCVHCGTDRNQYFRDKYRK